MKKDIKAERDNFDKRISEISRFLETESAKLLQSEERGLLILKRAAMLNYRNVLQDMIDYYSERKRT